MKSEEVLSRNDHPTLETNKIQTRLIRIEPTSTSFWQHQPRYKALSINPHPILKLFKQIAANILQMAIA